MRRRRRRNLRHRQERFARSDDAGLFETRAGEREFAARIGCFPGVGCGFGKLRAAAGRERRIRDSRVVGNSAATERIPDQQHHHQGYESTHHLCRL